ncbi:phosphatidate cytidylyltransferase [Kocuria coralli]|uniref:Phosphatidate cytidylyltransferase n=1 Tax=Kocuria coralli TaxID=1461025 RepID=A0A5J5KXD4_9MICC|nr:phosphatidate cytidylyltransferase [Kocuria coralli]KAA9393565.1 phosphatidate cytidylyltransferase [Kocuria coralli]
MPAVDHEAQPESGGAAPKPSRAGRDLPAAIAVGVGLLVMLGLGLFVVPPLIALLAAAAASLGVFELCRSLAHGGIRIPILPASIMAAVMPVAAFYGGAQALIIATILASLVVITVRVFGSRQGMMLSVMGALFALTWVALCLSLLVLLFRTEQGAAKVLIVILMAVGNDTFGYFAGVLFGKHPMAPRISPKKTWEGFAGSMTGSMILASLLIPLLLGDPWWHGLILAFCLVWVAALGDFAESMVKREIGVKDMGTLLPGHGGVMDRIDSIVFVAPVGYVVFELLHILQ